MSRRRRRLYGRWVVAGGVAAALAVITLQFAVSRDAYDAELATIRDAYARTPAFLHVSAIRRAINGVYRDLAVTVGELPARPEAVQLQLGRHWPVVDAHLRALEASKPLPRELGSLQQLESLLAALRAAEPRLVEARTADEARDVLRWQLLPLVREVVRTIDGMALESARTIAAGGARLQRAHAHADRLALVLYFSVVVAVVATGGLAWAVVSRSEAEVQRRLEELDAFAGRVAHDLRSPLQPALLTAGALRATCPIASQELIDRVERCMRQAAELVDALLLFARSGATPDPSARARVDAVLREFEPELTELARAERATLSIEAEPDLEACIDPTNLRVIINNLARNAILYLGDGGARDVRVVAAAAGPREVSLRVSDTGPGIPAEVRGRLFQPFQRGSARPGGTGLGLATVHRLVDAHGGAIEVATREGHGTTFVVRLPRPYGEARSRVAPRCARVPDR